MANHILILELVIIELKDIILFLKRVWASASKIENRLSAEFIDTGLDDNTTYKYRIKAFSFGDVESAPTKVLRQKTKALPLPATNIKSFK